MAAIMDIIPNYLPRETFTMPIREWITLSSFLEKQRLKNADGGAMGAEAVRVRKAYIDRALKLATSMTELIAFAGDDNGNDSDSDEDEEIKGPPPEEDVEDRFDNTVIVAENFRVLFHVTSDEDFLSPDMWFTSAVELIEKCTIEQIGNIVECLSSVDFIPSLRDKKRVRFNESNQELKLFLNKIGLIFFELFSRGSVYRGAAGAGGNGGVSSAQNKESCNPINEASVGAEDVGRGKKARTRSIIDTEYLFGNITLSDAVEELQEKQLPMSICRAIGDLIYADDSFQSLIDILDELEPIADRPDVFMEDPEQPNLNFPEDCSFGRSDEFMAFYDAAMEALDLSHQGDTTSLVLIGGDIGSGKSHLAQQVMRRLSQPGPGPAWSCISGKFDQAIQNNHSLSAILSALDNFFRGLAAVERPQPFEDILQAIERRIHAPGIIALSNLIPSFRILFSSIFVRVVEDDSDSENEVYELEDDSASAREHENEDTFNATTIRNRLHYLIRQLFHAMSSPLTPTILCLDDMQWADRDSLDLVSSLLMDSHELRQNAPAAELPPCLVVAGAFRNNEIHGEHILSNYFNMFRTSDFVRTTSIKLGGLEHKDTNIMISHALRLPLRLTKPLAETIHKKTMGNPLFMKSMLSSLVRDKTLAFSLVEKGWKWDMEVILAQPIDDNVANIMRRIVLGMPVEVQRALTIVSCFGSRVDELDVKLLSSSEVFSNDIGHLDTAIKEGVMGKCGTSYVFPHDIIQETAYRLLPPASIEDLHFRIGVHLTSEAWKSGALKDNDALMMRATDQVNAAKMLAISNPRFRATFAMLNYEAARSSMKNADFPSALSYSKNGLYFLGVDCWVANFDLSLQLHETACLACHSNGLTEEVKIYYDIITQHTSSLDHQINAHKTFIQSLASIGKPKEAIDKAFNILEQLGVEFPSEVTPAVVHSDIVSTKKQLNHYGTEALISNQIMVADKVLMAINLMDLMAPYLFMVNEQMFALLACRMVQLSLLHGSCKETAHGLASYGISCVVFLQDVDEGYQLAKTSLQILERFNECYSYFPRVATYCFIMFWKQPLQSAVQEIMKLHEHALLVGENECGSFAALIFTTQNIMCGTNLESIQQECAKILSKLLKSKQVVLAIPQISNHILISTLTGKSFEVPGILFKDWDQLLQYALDNKRLTLAQRIFFHRTVAAVYFNNFREAADMANKYFDVLKFGMSFFDIYQTLYLGVASFYLSRDDKNNSTKWKDQGKTCVDRFRVWVNHSKWNFENKTFLLEAELHFSREEYDAAESKYKSAIESSSKHRFVHEEGLAHELCGAFYKSQGRVEEERDCMTKAAECFKEWGAHAVLQHCRFDDYR